MLDAPNDNECVEAGKNSRKKNKHKIQVNHIHIDSYTEKNKVTPSVTRIGIIEKLFKDNEKSREAKVSPR